MRWFLVLIGGVAAALLGWWAGTGQVEFIRDWTPMAKATPAPVLTLSDLAPPSIVHSLGRIRPRRMVSVAGPGRFAVVVERLLVEEGERVERGQVIALLDSIGVEEAEIQLLEVDIADADRELQRARSLGEIGTDQAVDRATSLLERLRALKRRAEAELDRSRVRAPIAGMVLEILTHAGEKVGPAGIIEIAEIDYMEARAEVFENEIGRIRIGQKALVSSPAFSGGVLEGKVVRVGLKVERQGVLETDPVAQVDARVVAVAVALDDSQAAATFTDLRVDVRIDVEEPETQY